MDDKLGWCLRQKKGLRIIDPNENLANEYIDSSEETLLILRDISGKSNMWVATTKYYCEYFAAYALLMRFGFKSEIHECTIEFLKFLEKERIIKNISKILTMDKRLRIENQYYLKNKKVNINFDKLRDFVLYIKDKISMISNDDIIKLRNKIKHHYNIP